MKLVGSRALRIGECSCRIWGANFHKLLLCQWRVNSALPLGTDWASKIWYATSTVFLSNACIWYPKRRSGVARGFLEPADFTCVYLCHMVVYGWSGLGIRNQGSGMAILCQSSTFMQCFTFTYSRHLTCAAILPQCVCLENRSIWPKAEAMLSKAWC